MTIQTLAFEHIIEAYLPIFSASDFDIEKFGTEAIPIPTFPLSLVNDLLLQAYFAFSKLPNVINIDGEVIVVGDIHGNIRDLVRILRCNRPPDKKFLFLGDYVDRGEFSFEVIVLLFALSLKYPQHVALLRGNHEFELVNSVYGFKEQMIGLFRSTEAYDFFNQVFKFLPIAATITSSDGSFSLCVHGGISPQLKSLCQLNELNRMDDSELLQDIVWSDPSNSSITFAQNPRGHGYTFGRSVLFDFLKSNGVKRLIRAHECVNGVRRSFEDALITVFSSSNYKGDRSNCCGFLKFHNDGVIETSILECISVLKRDQAILSKIGYNKTTLNSLRLSPLALTPNRNGFHISGSRSGNSLSINSCSISRKKFPAIGRPAFIQADFSARNRRTSHQARRFSLGSCANDDATKSFPSVPDKLPPILQTI